MTVSGLGPHSSRSIAFIYALAFGLIVVEFSERAYGDHHNLNDMEIDIKEAGLSPSEISWIYEGTGGPALRIDNIWDKLHEIKLDIYKQCERLLQEGGLNQHQAEYEIYDALRSFFVESDPETNQARDRMSTGSQDLAAHEYVSNGFRT